MNYQEKLTQLIADGYNTLRSDDNYYYLYKHFAIDPELHTLGVLNNNNFLYSSPSAFNDPYDCFAILDYDFTTAPRSLAEHILNERITNKQFKERKASYLSRLKNHPDFLGWSKESRKDFHITCLNNNPLNILMWSHYADHHKGFLLELRFKKQARVNLLELPLPVNYDDTYPILHYPWDVTPEYCIKNFDYGCEVILKRLLNKAEVWSYEKEFRLLAEDNKDSPSKILQSFDPLIISSVVLGTQIRDDHKYEIEKAVKNFNTKHKTDVNIFQANLHPNEYKLMVPEHPRLN